MMKYLAGLVALSVGFLVEATGGSTLHAQVPQDHLDWHRYYPLEIGNLWEYHEAESPFRVTRFELVADTTVEGHRYFERKIYDRYYAYPDTILTSVDFVRYDSSGFVIAVNGPEADTTAIEPCSDYLYFQRDLRLAFGAHVACPPSSPFDSLAVKGTYNDVWTAPGGENVEVAAIKTYTLGYTILSSFVADVGPVFGGNLWGPRLHYAVIDGRKYGSSELEIPVGEAFVPERRTTRIQIWGNPASNRLVVDIASDEVGDAMLQVFDAWGRRVHRRPVTLRGGREQVHLSTAELAAGSYFVRLTTAESRAAARFSVLR